MLHPVGSLPPRVYWRRRVAFAVFVVAGLALVAFTVHTVTSRNGTPTASAAVPPLHTSSGLATTSGGHPATSATTHASATTPSPTNTAVGTCAKAQLKIAATTSAPTYKVGASPVVEILVENTGPNPCSTDLADPEIELRVYNGAARVWGSHDCKIVPGTDVETLLVGKTIGKTIEWSGLSSEPKCAGIRQRVGAGTYTLYALLDGVQGTPSTFTIS